MDAMPSIMTPKQVANYLQVNQDTVYRYIRRGKLAASRLGRTYRIRRESVDRLLLVTRSPASISVRRYSKAELMRFVQDDQLDEATRALADRFIEVAEAKTR